MRPSEDIELLLQRPMDCLAFMEKKRNELANTGHKVDNETFITHLLNSLPQAEYEGAILVVKERLRGRSCEPAEVEQLLEDKYLSMMYVKDWEEEENDYALFATPAQKKGKKKQFKGRCGYCGEIDFSSLKDQEYDWTRSVYSGACEQIPHDIPKPLGKHVQTTHYVDANLHHDLATGKAVTAVLHFLNQTPIDAYTKRQSTVETATYGSEFVAARTAVDQIIDIRTTLRYLGVPIRDKSYMFGDNRSVVTSSTIPNSTISKRHYLASYH